jgi:mycofactocin precursor
MDTDVIETAVATTITDVPAGEPTTPAQENRTAEEMTAENLTAEDLTAEDLTAEDLIEEVSIDGMCGVY